jgi:hypothetical protein
VQHSKPEQAENSQKLWLLSNFLVATSWVICRHYRIITSFEAIFTLLSNIFNSLSLVLINFTRQIGFYNFIYTFLLPIALENLSRLKRRLKRQKQSWQNQNRENDNEIQLEQQRKRECSRQSERESLSDPCRAKIPR